MGGKNPVGTMTDAHSKEQKRGQPSELDFLTQGRTPALTRAAAKTPSMETERERSVQCSAFAINSPLPSFMLEAKITVNLLVHRGQS
jgi:hypothetical protein